MKSILSFQQNAVDYISCCAKESAGKDREMIQNFFGNKVDVDEVINHIFECCRVTLNFHPDRITNDGTVIIDRLVSDGQYHSQFVTGTSNGGRTAHPGGDRDLWEERLFGGYYHKENTTPFRPKYGALNIFNYVDGASPRFGSCFFVLKSLTMKRCTFSYGDSSENPDSLGTHLCFYPVMRALLFDIQKTGKFLNQSGFSNESAMQYLMNIQHQRVDKLGRNLDYSIETQIHGSIDLSSDISDFYLDKSYCGTEIYDKAAALMEKYNIHLGWIPKRQLPVSAFTDEFRGPAIPKLAERIGLLFDRHMIDAALIGRASVDSIVHFEKWCDLGNEFQLFQYFKQIWHTVAFFG